MAEAAVIESTFARRVSARLEVKRLAGFLRANINQIYIQSDLLWMLWNVAGRLFPDTFGGLTRGLERAVTSVFGSSNARYLKRLQPRVDAINALEPKYQAMTDAELREQTDKFRKRLAAGETLDDILVEAFAVCREAGRRVLGMRHYDVQMMGGMVLHSGNIAEMVTGEGKTLVATLPAYLNALEGKGVHVVTVNDYLARRDMEWMGPLYMALGLTVGAIQSDMDADRAAEGLRLRHHLRHEQRVRLRLPARQHASGGPGRRPLSQATCSRSQGPLHYAIIDEVDNILIDEARTPLIISGPAHDDVTTLRQGRPDRPAVEEGRPLRGQREGALGPPDRRRGPRGRAAGRRGELLHGRQHGVAAPDRQLAEGPSPLQTRRQLRRQGRRDRHRRRVHRPPDAGPQLERRAAPGGRGQGRRARSRKRTRPWPRSRCRTSSSSTTRSAA